MKINWKILVVVLCLATFFTLAAKSSLHQRLENLERTVETLDKRVDYLEKRFNVSNVVMPGHQTYIPYDTRVSGEELNRIHREIEKAQRERRTRRPMRRGRISRFRRKSEQEIARKYGFGGDRK